jgi:Fur family zinc uptake transcriptional regulator
MTAPACCEHNDDLHAVHSQDVDGRVAHIEAVCVARGLRLTPLRREVLELVLQAQKPVGAYELLAKLSAKDGRPAAPPTVYRSLDFLLEQGFIHRLASINAFIPCCHPREGHQAAFLICEQCHRVQETSAANLVHALGELAQQGHFVPKTTLIEISGLCARCQQGADHDH